MTSPRYHYARLRRQLRFLIKQYNRQPLPDLRKPLADRIQQHCRRLAGVISGRQLRRLFTGAALGLLLGAAPLHAQPFATFQENPFQIVSNNSLMFNTFVDIDNDGDLDMFTTGPAEDIGQADIDFYENIGNATAPSFEIPVPMAFGLNTLNAISTDFVDIDADGDLDAFLGIGFGEGQVLFAENTGTVENPEFAEPVENPFGIEYSSPSVILELEDMDNDGDYDLFLVSNGGNFQYFENIGTPMVPAFTEAITNPFNLAPAPANTVTRIFNIADFDGDCDFDLYYYEFSSVGSSEYYLAENGGTAENPGFESPEASPFDIPLPVVSSQVPEFADLDDDGDLDLMLGVYYNGVYYYQNLRNNSAPDSENAAVNGLINEPYYFEFTDFPFSDVDGDFLQGVRITRLPMFGTLSLNDVPIQEHQLVPVAELSNMAFTAEPDALGNPYDDFYFQVTDGTDFNCTNFTMLVNILLTDLEEVAKDDRLQVLPNPASTSLHLRGQLPAGISRAQLRLRDAQGRTLRTTEIQSAGGMLDLDFPVAHLPAGLYWLEVYGSDYHQSLRFIKQ